MIAKKLYRWSIDRVNGRFISGWCFHRLKKLKPVTITIAADSNVLGSVTNRALRPDLKDQALHPNGVCGFDFSFPADINLDEHAYIHLYFNGGSSPAISLSCREIVTLKPDLQRPICFMHIPKTAGTSFNAFARQCFAGEHFVSHIERSDPADRAVLATRADYLSGHLIFGDLAALVSNASDFYSIIREPYAHLHSHLNYVRKVIEASRDEAHYQFRHNQIIKSLSAKLNTINFARLDEVAGFVKELDDYELDFFDNQQTRYFLDHRPDRVSSAELEQAGVHLGRFRIVGLTEQYDRFRDRFCDDIGLPAVQQPLKSNISGSYRLFDLTDRDFRKVLQPLVSFDLQLYQQVSERFWRE